MNQKYSFLGFGALFLMTIMVFCLEGCIKNDSPAQIFYVNSINGNDTNDGLSPQSPWKSLKRASQEKYSQGEKLLLSKGCVFKGSLELKANGIPGKPVIVSSYTAEDINGTSLPVIDAKGYLAAVYIKNGKNIEINNLELIADAGDPLVNEASDERYGILAVAEDSGIFSNIKLKELYIHHIFSTENVRGGGQNPTSNKGMGIVLKMLNGNARIKNVVIEGCTIENTGHAGMWFMGAGPGKINDEVVFLENLRIENNILNHTGGPGMVPSRCKNVDVRGNIVDHSGSSIDPRMHNRGSGIWPWGSEDVLIEKNKFMNAFGKADSHGAHIDFNCRNVVVQYNLSLNNAGGFVEILGNNHNCCYRYNISINDGYRVKGENKAIQEGKVLWTSGYVGRNNIKHGPYNSYIYNNTIYVKEEILAKFSLSPTTKGLLVANNIFHILGETADVLGDQDNQKIDNRQSIERAIFTNNVYSRSGVLPESLQIQDENPYIGKVGFKNPGATEVSAYLPSNEVLVKNNGIVIEKIPGDTIGLKRGLRVEYDYFGNPIHELPDIGAIEIQ